LLVTFIILVNFHENQRKKKQPIRRADGDHPIGGWAARFPPLINGKKQQVIFSSKKKTWHLNKKNIKNRSSYDGSIN
jgi:hypothetical protein